MANIRQVWISTTEAAELLDEDPRTVQRKAKAGTYPGQKLPGLRGSYIFNPTVIERIAADRKALSSPSSASSGDGGALPHTRAG